MGGILRKGIWASRQCERIGVHEKTMLAILTQEPQWVTNAPRTFDTKQFPRILVNFQRVGACALLQALGFGSVQLWAASPLLGVPMADNY